MRRGLVLGLLLISAACAPRQGVSTAADDHAKSGESPVITLERTACFGSCPVYRIAVASDGTLTYEGRAHVRQLGNASTQISREHVEALLSELVRAGYLSLANRYTPAEPACGRYVTDLPSVITSVRVDGQAKRIEHDYGCGSAPGALVVLEQRIDEVLGSSRWTGR